MLKIDINKLLNSAEKVMVERGVKSLDNVPFSNENESIWSKISVECYQNMDIKNIINIFSWWNCNTFNFSSLLKQKIEKRHKNTEDLIRIILNQEEWDSAKKFVSEDKQRFKREFDRIISGKIQEKGFNCWLECGYNAFKKKESRKTVCNYWSGKYYCLNEKCGVFKAK